MISVTMHDDISRSYAAANSLETSEDTIFEQDYVHV